MPPAHFRTQVDRERENAWKQASFDQQKFSDTLRISTFDNHSSIWYAVNMERCREALRNRPTGHVKLVWNNHTAMWDCSHVED